MNRERVAVYATDEKEELSISEKMIEEVLTIAAQDDVKISVVGVLPKCSVEYAEQTESLHRYSISIGAEMDLIYSSDPTLAIINYIKQNNITEIIISDCNTAGAITKIMPNVKVKLVQSENSKIFSFVSMDLLCYALSEKKHR